MPSSPCGCCIRKHSQHPALAPSARARARVHQRRSPSFLLPSLLYPRSEHSPRLKTLLALLLSLSPGLVLSQNPALYTPRYGAGSAVLNNTLYLVGGITGVISPSATRDVLAVSLEAPFTADAIPWIRRTTTGVPISDAYVAASKDQSRLVLVGFNSSYPLAIVYDFLLDQWVLPPTPTPPLTSRVAVGIVTDTDTGLFAMYGGLTPSPDSKLSSELDILYPNSSSINQWTWSPPTTEAMMPALFQPMMFYLSGSQSVLILGGCDGYLPTSGLSSCAPLSKGYLISTALQETPIASRIPSIMALKSKEGVIPTSRLSPCNTLLPNGNILVHGGVTFGNTESLSDTWVLDTKTWTWTQISLKNAPTQGRAGATCQVVAPNLVVVVGGYDGVIITGKQFTDNQIGFINTDTWAWTDSFNPHRQTAGLNLGNAAIVGISAGSVIVFGLIVILCGRLYWRRRKRQLFNKPSRSNNPRHDSLSKFPLIPSPFEDSGLSAPDRLGSRSTQSLNPGFLNGISNRSLPLIIMPLSTSSSTERVSLEPTSQRASKITSSGPTSPRALKTNRFSAKPGVDLPESDRLPQNEADIQRGHYVRTLQHNRQYEKRQLPLHRNYTDASRHTTFRHDDDTNLHYEPDMATGVINLRDIEFGEEFSTPPPPSFYQKKNHEMFNLPRAYDPPQKEKVKGSPGDIGNRQIYYTESSPNNQTGQFRTDKAEITSDSIEMQDFEDEEESVYTPGVGGPITALEVAREARAAAAASLGQQSPYQMSSPTTGLVTERALGATRMSNQGYSASLTNPSFPMESETLADSSGRSYQV